MKNDSLYVIADSSGLISLVSTQDVNHQRALEVEKNLKNVFGNVIIPAEVLAETINVLGKKTGHSLAVTAVQELLNSSVFSITESSTDIREQSLKLFAKYPASVSFTDCLVMAFADHFETKFVFGFDEIFGKSGYLLPGDSI